MGRVRVVASTGSPTTGDVGALAGGTYMQRFADAKAELLRRAAAAIGLVVYLTMPETKGKELD